jgi:hypothetical protein
MNFRLTILGALASAACTALPSSAQNLTPGLWEVSSKMQSGSGTLEMAMAAAQKHMANLDPAQRKKIEDTLAQQGVSLSGVGATGVVMKMCMSKEMAAQNQLPMTHQQGDCSATRSPVVGNTMQVAFTCSKPQASGEGQVTFAGDKAYQMKMKVASTATGNPETMNIDASGRWLGADCGGIKPMALPGAK